MNRIKEIATETFKAVPMDSANPDKWIDNFVLAYTKAVVFECSDIVRRGVKDASPEVASALKVAAVDILDNFGI